MIFYRQFYNDNNTRKLILGINPGRHGAGLTGVPFTDTPQLTNLGIDSKGIDTKEVSAVFIYKMIHALGGEKDFYKQFYINSPLPLGLLIKNDKNNWVNANYYDTKELTQATLPFIEDTLRQFEAMSLNLSTVYCLGQGKNFTFLNKLNKTHQCFGAIIPLPHPRYVMQYKSRKINEYIELFRKVLLG